MSNKGKFSKLAWLALFVVFAIIAGGACGGSSSGNGGGGDDPVTPDGNVTPIGDTDHELLPELEKHYVNMPNGTIFIGNKITAEELNEAMPEIKAALEEGKHVGMYGPTRERIAQLHVMLGTNIFRDETEAASFAEAADNDPPLEFFLITKRDDGIFQHKWQYVDGSENFTFEEDVASSDVTLPSNGETPPVSSDEEIKEMQRMRPKSERLREIAASIAEWPVVVNELAAKEKDRRASALNAIRAAGDQTLEDIAYAFHDGDSYTFKDQKDGYKFPTVHYRLSMYSCYSFRDKVNYYQVISNASMNPENNYKHYYTSSIFGPYDVVQNSTYSYRVAAKPNFPAVERGNMPANLNQHKSHTDSISIPISGKIGVGKDGPSGEIGAGVNIGRSTTYETSDYKVINHTSGNVVDIEYLFDTPSSVIPVVPVAWTPLNDASDISRTNFTSEESWIWSVDRKDQGDATFTPSITYMVPRVKGCDLMHFVRVDTATAKPDHGKSSYKLPVPPTLAVDTTQLSVRADGRQTGNQLVKFNLLSDSSWTAKSNAGWVTLSYTSGGETGDTEKEIVVTIDKNTSSSGRNTTITVSNARGETGTIEVSQEGAR